MYRTKGVLGHVRVHVDVYIHVHVVPALHIQAGHPYSYGTFGFVVNDIYSHENLQLVSGKIRSLCFFSVLMLILWFASDLEPVVVSPI